MMTFIIIVQLETAEQTSFTDAFLTELHVAMRGQDIQGGQALDQQGWEKKKCHIQ